MRRLSSFAPARLSGKRLMVPWNALPGVERQRKVGDREVLIDWMWSAESRRCQTRNRDPTVLA